MDSHHTAYSLFCDESHYLEHDKSAPMVLGYVMCRKSKVREANEYIRFIKEKHRINGNVEIKWTKTSKSAVPMLKDLIDYFFASDYLSFRAVIANKDGLDHERFGQTHDEWYFKMYYYLFRVGLTVPNQYWFFLDIKEKYGMNKVHNLRNILINSYRENGNSLIRNIQLERSEQHELMQLCDLLIGSIAFCNSEERKSRAKLEVVDYLIEKSGLTLKRKTSYREDKFNLFVWDPQDE